MLSEYEKKAIENLKDFKSISILYGNTFTMFLEQLKKYQEATDTVLNLITKLQKENEEKDKQIDLIIEEYEYYDRINFKNFCEDKLRKDKCIQDCKNCAKKYFEKLVKEKGE